MSTWGKPYFKPARLRTECIHVFPDFGYDAIQITFCSITFSNPR